MKDNHVMGSPCKKGHSGLRYKGSRGCVECNRERVRRPEQKAQMLRLNKARYIVVRDETLERQKSYRGTPRGRALQMLQGISSRSRKKDVAASITIEWLTAKLEAGKCELTGLPFDFTRAGIKGPYAPSIDRISSQRGYEPDNCRMVLWALNTAFSWWGEDSFRTIAEVWLNRRCSECDTEHDRDRNAAINIRHLGGRHVPLFAGTQAA